MYDVLVELMGLLLVSKLAKEEAAEACTVNIISRPPMGMIARYQAWLAKMGASRSTSLTLDF